MLPRMPEPALLYTLDEKVKSITVNGNNTGIHNESLTIVGRMFHHTVRGLRSCRRVEGLGYPEGLGYGVLSNCLARVSEIQGLARGYEIRGPT